MYNKETKFTLPLFTFFISILCGYLYLLILGWNNFFGVAETLSRYGYVNFGEYFYTSLFAVFIPLVIITHFNYKSDKNHLGFFSRYLIYKYLYFFIIFFGSFISAALGGEGGGFILIFAIRYLTVSTPFFIVIDLLTFSQKHFTAYKKLFPLVSLLIIFTSIFAFSYFSSVKSDTGRCPKADSDCFDHYYAEQAIKLNNVDECNKAPIPERCIALIAIKSHDFSFCNKIPQESKFRDWCYSDPYYSECMLIVNDTEKRACMGKLCEKIIENITREFCFKNIDHDIDMYKKYGPSLRTLHRTR